MPAFKFSNAHENFCIYDQTNKPLYPLKGSLTFEWDEGDFHKSQKGIISFSLGEEVTLKDDEYYVIRFPFKTPKVVLLPSDIRTFEKDVQYNLEVDLAFFPSEELGLKFTFFEENNIKLKSVLIKNTFLTNNTFEPLAYNFENTPSFKSEEGSFEMSFPSFYSGDHYFKFYIKDSKEYFSRFINK